MGEESISDVKSLFLKLLMNTETIKEKKLKGIFFFLKDLLFLVQVVQQVIDTNGGM